MTITIILLAGLAAACMLQLLTMYLDWDIDRMTREAQLDAVMAPVERIVTHIPRSRAVTVEEGTWTPARKLPAAPQVSLSTMNMRMATRPLIDPSTMRKARS